MTDSGNDEELLAALREAISARSVVPPEFVAAGKNAFAWHGVDAELARLTYDSTRSPDLTAVTRTDAASIRSLTFTSARLTIELEVAGDALLGQVIPAQTATIEIQTQEQVESITSDEIGCFSVQPVPRGSFRLRCRAEGGVDVLTGWITL